MGRDSQVVRGEVGIGKGLEGGQGGEGGGGEGFGRGRRDRLGCPGERRERSFLYCFCASCGICFLIDMWLGQQERFRSELQDRLDDLEGVKEAVEAELSEGPLRLPTSQLARKRV